MFCVELSFIKSRMYFICVRFSSCGLDSIDAAKELHQF